MGCLLKRKIYMIRARRVGWHEVSKEKAMDYARKRLKDLGFCASSKESMEFQKRYVAKFVRGINLDELMKVEE